MTDKMPGCAEIGEQRPLLLPLLYAVLAKMLHSGRVRLADALDGKCFRNRDQRDLIGSASSALSRPRNALAHGFDIRPNRSGLDAHGGDSSTREDGRRGAEGAAGEFEKDFPSTYSASLTADFPIPLTPHF